jgi:cytochrome c553
VKRYLIVLLILALGGAVTACPPRCRHVAPVVPAVVVAPVVTPVLPVIAPVAVFTPLVVQVPSYGAVYVPPAAAPAVQPAAVPANPAAQPAQVAPAVKPADAPPMPTPDEAAPQTKTGPGNWQANLATDCARCHTGPASKGSFVIFDGPNVLSPKFDAAARAMAFAAIHDREMPLGADRKPAPLNDERTSSYVPMLRLKK